MRVGTVHYLFTNIPAGGFRTLGPHNAGGWA
jgi:hypothetical protein